MKPTLILTLIITILSLTLLSQRGIAYPSDTLTANFYFQKAQNFQDENVQPDSAIFYFQQAAVIYETAQQKVRQQTMLLQIAQVYHDQKNYERTLTEIENLKETGELSSRLQLQLLALKGLTLRKVNKISEAIETYTKALELKDELKMDALTAQIYLNLGQMYNAQQRYIKTVEYLENFLEIGKVVYGEDAYELVPTYNTMGFVYSHFGYFDKSFEYYENARRIYPQHRSKDNRYVAILQNTGIAYNDIGDYEKAIGLYQEGLRVLDTLPKKGGVQRADLMNNIGVCLQNRGEAEEAFDHHQQSLDIRKELLPTPHYKIAMSYINLGYYYLERDNWERALFYFRAALDMNVELYGETNPSSANQFYNYGFALIKAGQPQESLEWLEKTLSIFKNYFGTKHQYVALVQNEIGNAYFQLKNYEAALDYFGQAMKANAPSTDIIGKEFSNVWLNSVFALQSLKGKAMSLLRLDLEAGDKIAETTADLFQECDQLINFIRNQLQNNEDKTIFNATAYEIYAGGIELNYHLYQQTQNRQYLEQAFYYTEKSKANTLLATQSANFALQFAGLPETLLEEEKKLTLDIRLLKQQLLEADLSSDSLLIKKSQKALFPLQEEYNNFIRNLERDFPFYFEMKYQAKAVTAAQMQNYLSNEMAFVNFFTTEKEVYVFVLTKEQSHFFNLTKTPSFKSDMAMFRKAVGDLDFIQDATVQADALYQKLGWELYQHYFQQVQSVLPAYIERLILSPGDVLTSLPFDVLLTEAVEVKNYRNLPYLLRNYAIQYTLSASYLWTNKNFKSSASKTYGGFAPDYSLPDLLTASSEIMWSDLPYSRQKVLEIAQLWQGDAYLSENGTELMFKNRALDYQMLHLSAHTELNERNPIYSKIILQPGLADTVEDNKLHFFELYGLHLQAELAVLDACNTGVGKLEKGEGVFNYARAFHYAGCPAVVMSLWSIPDEASAQIVGSFFENLKKGQTKDKALQVAKLTWLEKSDPLHARPVYWAGLISSGNPDSISQKNGLKWSKRGMVLVFVFILSIGGGIIYFVKR